MKLLTVSKNDSGQRLDKYLIKYFNKASSGFVYKNLRKKHIKLNNHKASGAMRISTGDEIQLYFSQDRLSELSTYASLSDNKDSLKKKHLTSSFHMDEAFISDLTDLATYGDIVYEDDNIIIFDKKPNVLSHKSRKSDISLNEILLEYVCKKNEISAGKKKSKNRTDTSSKWLKSSQSTDIFTPSICNRLDRNTSGILIFAKTYAASVVVNTLIKNHRLKKYYLAVVEGGIKEPAILTGWLIKNKKDNIVRVSSHKKEGASYVQLKYEPLKIFDGADLEKILEQEKAKQFALIQEATEPKQSGGIQVHGEIKQSGKIPEQEKATLLRIRLDGGKPHQIRAQLKKAGHPIIGDMKYGNIKKARDLRSGFGLDHQLLYSWRIEWPGDVPEPLTNLSLVTMTLKNPFYDEQIPCIIKNKHKSDWI